MSTNDVPARVLVVGAGPVGLMLAALLARQGVACRLIDRNAAPVEESRATDVHARTLELLSTVGLAEPLIARGRKARGAAFYGSGRRIAFIPVHALSTPFPFILGVPQFETERVLLGELIARGGHVERGVQLEALTQSPDEAQVTLLHGGDGRREHARFDWVVGSDGAGSSVRQLLGLSFDGLSYPEHFMLADARLDWALPQDELHIFLTADGFFQALPMPGEGRVRLFVDVSGRQDSLEPTLEVFEELGRARSGHELRLSEPGWMSKFRVHRRMVPRYRVGRVLLAGDAAHVHSPVGGQGMNTGIQDAFNLAWKLALVATGRAGEHLLDSYHAERHAVARTTLSDTHLATRMSQLKHPVLRELRDVVSAKLSSFGPFPRWLAEVTGELRMKLPRSAIVASDRDSLLFADVLSDPAHERPSVALWLEFRGAPGAGHRAPDWKFGPAGGERRFFSLLSGRRHLLLLFDGDKATPDGYRSLGAIAGEVRARFDDAVETLIVVPAHARPGELDHAHAVLLDPGGQLHGGFGARAECLYLIRPDGYVGYRSQPADGEALLAYLGRLFGPRNAKASA